MYKTFDGFTNFSIYEGINVSNVQSGVNTQRSLESSTINNIYSDISRNTLDISNNIHEYNIIKTKLISNDMYHYNDTQDANTIFGYNEPKDTKTAINTDVNELKLYQNSIYITGIIACTTLLISAILISKK